MQLLRWLSRILMIAGVCFIVFFGYQYYMTKQNEKSALTEAQTNIEQGDSSIDITKYQPAKDESFAVLDVPKLGKSLPIVEGTDPDSLDRGVGHLDVSALPGQGEQIILSGHRDTVFKQFSQLEIGDEFVVQMEYGDFTYQIKDTKIVDANDTSVIGKMGEEALVVTTCYPFSYLGNAPERFVFYAYPMLDAEQD